MSFSVTLSAASNVIVSASFATANGTAIAPSDYVSTNGQLTFNPGDLSKSIDITINGDPTAEPDETFTVSLSNPVMQTSLQSGYRHAVMTTQSAAVSF
jgi:hypothetical protein